MMIRESKLPEDQAEKAALLLGFLTTHYNNLYPQYHSGQPPVLKRLDSKKLVHGCERLGFSVARLLVDPYIAPKFLQYCASQFEDEDTNCILTMMEWRRKAESVGLGADGKRGTADQGEGEDEDHSSHQEATSNSTAATSVVGPEGEADVNQLREEARQIYSRYIKPGAEFELNISWNHRKAMMDLFDQPDPTGTQHSEIRFDCFDTLFKLIAQNIQNNAYLRFCQTDVFEEHLAIVLDMHSRGDHSWDWKEDVNLIQLLGCDTSKKKSKSLSLDAPASEHTFELLSPNPMMPGSESEQAPLTVLAEDATSASASGGDPSKDNTAMQLTGGLVAAPVTGALSFSTRTSSSRSSSQPVPIKRSKSLREGVSRLLKRE